MKRTTFIIFSLLFFSSAIHAQSWEFVGLDSLVIFHLYVEGDTIYAGTWDRNNNLNSGLYYSSDGGNNWTQLDSLLGEGAILGLERNMDNTMYIIKCPCQAGSVGTLYKTTNNGQSWEPINNISNYGIRSIRISPFNPSEIYTIDVNYFGGGDILNSLFKSTDGGNSWEDITAFPSSSHGSALKFSFDLTDSMNLYVTVDTQFDQYLFKSTDKGNNWFFVSTPPINNGSEIYTDYFLPDRIYLIAKPYVSNDGGLSWFVADSGFTENSSYISFYQDKLTTRLLYILHTNGLYESGNVTFYWDRLEGSEYLPLDLPTSIWNLKNITIDETSKKIYLGTSEGLFRKNIVTNIINDESHYIINGFVLEQNYPNPFNPSTKILYQIPDRSFIKIKVYDMLGREIITLVEGEQLAGQYELVFESNNLPSGVYFYVLTAASESGIQVKEGKKMLLIK